MRKQALKGLHLWGSIFTWNYCWHCLCRPWVTAINNEHCKLLCCGYGRRAWRVILDSDALPVHFKGLSSIKEEACRLQWQPFPQLVVLCCCHHCKWPRAVRAQSIQTGSEHSMAAGWNSSFCCSRVATQHVASPSPPCLVCQTLSCSVFVPLSLCRYVYVFAPVLLGTHIWEWLIWFIHVWWSKLVLWLIDN